MKKKEKKPIEKTVQDETDAVEAGADAKPGKRPVTLKHFMVSGCTKADPEDRTLAFILATCAKTAHDEFYRKFPDLTIQFTVQAAVSDITKEQALGRDFWQEGKNWIQKVEKTSRDARQRLYFDLKDRAEAVQAAKRKYRIADWDTATEEQISAVHEEMKRFNEKTKGKHRKNT